MKNVIITRGKPIILLLAVFILSVFAGTAAAQPNAYIASMSDGMVSVIDTVTNTVTGTLHVGGNPVAVAVNPSGTRVYVTSTDGYVSVIDTSNNTVITTISVGFDPEGIAVNPAGTRVYVTRPSGSVSVIDTGNNTVIDTISLPSCIGVAVNPAGTRVFTANYTQNSVSVIDTSDNTVIVNVGVGATPLAIAVNPAGTRVYVSTYDGVSVINTGNNTVIASVNISGTGSYGIAVNPSGTRVYSPRSSNEVAVIDTSSNTVIGTVPVGGSPQGIDINPTGTRVYVATQGSATVSVIDTSNDTVIETINVGSTPYSSGKFIGPEPPADIAFTMTASPQRVIAGSNITYTIPVTNNGPNDSVNTVLTDVLPAGTTFVSADSTQGTCGNNDGVVKCDIGAMATGATETITVVVTTPPDSTTSLINKASVKSLSYEPDKANNKASKTTNPVLPSIIGYVKRPTGSPISGVTMDLTGDAAATVTTDGTGKFTFAGLLNGSYTVTPSLNGYKFTSRSRAVTVNSANSMVHFNGTNLFAITGYAKRADGSAIEGATITISGGIDPVSTTTDGTGKYTVNDFQNGSYTVTPSLGGYKFTPAGRSVTINYANANANFSGTNNFSITGYVKTADGSAVPGVTLTLGGGASAIAVTDGTGKYSFTALPNGDYTITPSQTGETFKPKSRMVTINGSNKGAHFTKN